LLSVCFLILFAFSFLLSVLFAFCLCLFPVCFQFLFAFYFLSFFFSSLLPSPCIALHALQVVEGAQPLGGEGLVDPGGGRGRGRLRHGGRQEQEGESVVYSRFVCFLLFSSSLPSFLAWSFNLFSLSPFLTLQHPFTNQQIAWAIVAKQLPGRIGKQVRPSPTTSIHSFLFNSINSTSAVPRALGQQPQPRHQQGAFDYAC
jgi:hypothetical protein